MGVAGDSATGGSSKAHYPQFWAMLYDPDAPLGQRFTKMARSAIARMYHSTAALTPDGNIIVAGCDRCAYFNCTDTYSPSPTGLPEYRVEVGGDGDGDGDDEGGGGGRHSTKQLHARRRRPGHDACMGASGPARAAGPKGGVAGLVHAAPLPVWGLWCIG